MGLAFAKPAKTSRVMDEVDRPHAGYDSRKGFDEGEGEGDSLGETRLIVTVAFRSPFHGRWAVAGSARYGRGGALVLVL